MLSAALRRRSRVCRQIIQCSWYLRPHVQLRSLGTIVSNKRRLFSYYSHCIPKPVHIKNKNFGKITNDFGFAGEDAFFTYKLNLKKLMQNDTLAPLFFIGVADGVGSWKPQKASDAAHYAQELMLSGIKFLDSATQKDLINGSDATTSTFDATHNTLSQKIAKYSSQYVNQTMHFDGASTLCIVNICEYKMDQFKCQLNGYILGDSGFCVYRHRHPSLVASDTDGKCCYESIYMTPAQIQGFGIPYQLGSHATANNIQDGHSLQHFNLQSRDIVVVGSDGLWDNLFQDEIADIICGAMTKYYNNWSRQFPDDNIHDTRFNDFVHAQIVNGDLTHKIMKQAYQNSLDRKKTTPWSQQMTQTVDMVYDGGKPDDITCVVVFIH